MDVLYSCLEGVWGNFSITSVSNTYYSFRVDTELACVDWHPITYRPDPTTTGSSGGGAGVTVFLVILFIILGAITAYLAIGIVYNVAVKKEKGLRMMPNYDFWTNVPSYMTSAVNRLGSAVGKPASAPQQTPGSGSYEQIGGKS